MFYEDCTILVSQGRNRVNIILKKKNENNPYKSNRDTKKRISTQRVSTNTLLEHSLFGVRRNSLIFSDVVAVRMHQKFTDNHSSVCI